MPGRPSQRRHRPAEPCADLAEGQGVLPVEPVVLGEAHEGGRTVLAVECLWVQISERGSNGLGRARGVPGRQAQWMARRLKQTRSRCESFVGASLACREMKYFFQDKGSGARTSLSLLNVVKASKQVPSEDYRTHGFDMETAGKLVPLQLVGKGIVAIFLRTTN